MPKRLPGRAQLASLCRLPVNVVGLTPFATERSLIRSGLLRQDENGAYCITPAGLRALADALDAGKIEDGLTLFARRKGQANDA